MELLGGPELADLVASLPGFLLAVTREGKLVGVTDNVAQHLGHSMVGTRTRGRGWVLSPLGAGCCPPWVQVALVLQDDGCWGVLDARGGCWVLGADPPASPPCR